MIGVGVGIPFNRTSFGGAPSFTNTNSLLLDGIDEYVNISTPTGLASSTQFSISFWNKSINYAGTAGMFELFTSTTDRVFLYYTAGILRFYINGAYTDWGITGINGAWTHFCFVYDGSLSTDITRAKIYINGSDVTTTGSGTIPSSLSATSSHTRNKIGVYNTLYHGGYMDEFRWYNYALTSGQVTDVYNSGTPKADDLATPAIHWWRMGDGDTFPTITDVGTTGGNNGTMTNMESGDIQTDTP